MLSRIVDFFQYYKVTTQIVFTSSEFPSYNYVSRPGADNKFVEAWHTGYSPVLVSGPEDCGKSIFLKQHLLKLNQDLAWFHCTTQTSFFNIASYLLYKSTPLHAAEHFASAYASVPEVEKELFILPRLADLIVRAGIGIVIENIHELPAHDQSLVSQLAVYITGANGRFIATTTCSSVKELCFITGFPKNKLLTIYLPHLQNYQKHKLISMGERALHIEMDKNLKREIVLHSRTARQCQANCYAICDGLGIKGRQRRLRHIQCEEGIVFLR